MSDLPHVTTEAMGEMLRAGRVTSVERDLIGWEENGWLVVYPHPTTPQRGLDCDGTVVATMPPPHTSPEVLGRIVSQGLRSHAFELVPSDRWKGLPLQPCDHRQV